MTPEQRHRAGVWQRFAPDGGDPACFWHPAGAAECSGRMQSCHIVSRQRLDAMRRHAALMARNGRPHNASLLAVSTDELIADSRNGVPGRAVCHGRNEGPVLHLPFYPEEFLIFLADYELDYLLATERSAA